MKVNREKLDNYLSSKIYIPGRTDRKEIYDSIEEKYGIPIDIMSDVCSGRKEVGELTDFEAFALLEAIAPKAISSYYNEEEVSSFQKMKFPKKEFKLPLVFDPMVQITPDQWIGKITAKELMALRDAQVIKYNENTQRTLRKVVHGENKYYKIWVNKRSVSDIRKFMTDNIYIPDDITLNMPLETTDWFYSNGELVIRDMDKLDIIDGYHRYLAISNAMNADPEFDYTMELRIVNYSEEKAKQFIFQKDQKNRMTTVDSKSLNQYDPANVVIERLNSDPMCNIHRMIGRNEQLIDSAYLSGLIRYWYFKNSSSSAQMREILTVVNELKQKFNALTEANVELLNRAWTKREMNVAMYCFAKADDDYIRAINILLKETEDVPNALFDMRDGQIVRRKLINTYEKILGKKGS